MMGEAIKMKQAVSTEIRQRVLELRRRYSLREVSEQAGLPLGTVKTICSRSGAFRDNLKHRELFSLPPMVASASTAVVVPELPAQQVVTGDKEIDAVLWLQQVVSTGQPDLIAKAMEAKARIKTPMEKLEKRYRDILTAKNPGNLFAALSSFGFGNLEDQAKRAVRRNVLATEALARFGSETGVFTNTPAEDFIVAALDGVKFEGRHGLPEFTPKVARAFRAHPGYLPHTLSDCLHELVYWSNLYRLRHAVCKDAGDGIHEEWVRRDFVFELMATIRPRSKHEALAVMKYMMGNGEGDDHMDRTGAEAILLNLVETR
jgi:hypothetical protein